MNERIKKLLQSKNIDDIKLGILLLKQIKTSDEIAEMFKINRVFNFNVIMSEEYVTKIGNRGVLVIDFLGIIYFDNISLTDVSSWVEF